MRTNIMQKTNRVVMFLVLTVLFVANGQTVFAANSSIGLGGRDSGNNSTTQIRAGQDANWVLDYNNASNSPASATITNAIPTGSTYKGGSVQVPPGWTSEFSADDGTSYSGVDPGTSATNLRFSNPVVSEPGNGAGQISSQPLTSTAQSGTGEDAYIPIPFKGRYFGLVHHSTQSGNEIVCSSQIPNACDNYPVALNLSGQTDFYTSINPMTYTDVQNSRLFFAVQRDTGYGIVCWDLENDQLCAGNGYTQLSASGTKLGPDQPSRLLGVVKSGSCLHAWDVNLVMYSFDPATFATSCGGFGNRNLASAYSLPTYDPNQHNAISPTYGPVGSAEVIDGKIYTPINYSFKADLFSANIGENSRIVCFDPAVSNGLCSGWSTPNIGGSGSFTQLITGIFKDVNNANNPCVFFIDAFTVTTLTRCYDKSTGVNYSADSSLVNNVVGDATGLAGLMASYEEIQTTNSAGDDITIFPFSKFASATNSGAAGCYNWDDADECAGWGSNTDGETLWSAWTGSAAVNGGNTRDYGYAVDETGCLLGLGDSGWLWSFSADNGSVPCRRTISTVTVNPSAYYCDGDGNVTGWDKIKVSNLTLSDFQQIFVTVHDSTGAVVSGLDQVDIVPTAGVLDISSLPYSGNTQDISVDVLFVALNNDPWSGDVVPVASVTFQGDDAQICYQTVAQDDCNVPTITNTANSITTQLNDDTTDTQTASYSLGLVLSSGKVCGASTTQPGSSSPLSTLAVTGQTALKGLLGLFVLTSGTALYMAKRHPRTRYSRR